MEILKDILKEARKKSGLTQYETACKANITQSNYSQYESGRVTPSLPIFTKLAVLLNFDMNDLKKSVMEELR